MTGVEKLVGDVSQISGWVESLRWLGSSPISNPVHIANFGGILVVDSLLSDSWHCL